MISFVNDIRSFFEQRKQIYVKKMQWTALTCVGAVVVLASLAIALSKIIPILIIIVGSVAFAIWCFLKFRILEKILNFLKEKEDELEQLKKRDPANFSLVELLKFANEEECKTLGKFAGKKFDNAEQFDLVVRKKATNGIEAFIKRVKGVDKEFTIADYSDMLDLAGRQFKLNRDGRNDRDFEAHIVKSAFEKMIESMDEKDRKSLEREVNKYAEQHLGKKNLNITLSAAGLLAAKLGGFATYTMASSLLAGISSVFGVTLPFGVYTGLAATLGTVMGPIGIGAISLWGLHKITSADVKTTILIVLAVASIRERLIYKYLEKFKTIKEEVESGLQQISVVEARLARISLTDKSDTAFLGIMQDIKPEAIEHLPKTDN